MTNTRSAKVQRILRLEGRAAASRARYESELARIAPARHRAEQLRHQALSIKVTLRPHELAQLRRARSGV